MEKNTINSNSYWDSRFATNWESNEGPDQSRFFAQLAVENLPAWLFEQIKKESLTVADWGCAQGDGTDVLAKVINQGQVVGIDFSETAIKQASERYPNISFRNEDWLENSNNKKSFDIIFSSNTLEHFSNPYEVLEILTQKAKKAVVLALPYREKERIPEHFHSFLPENIPLHLNTDFQLVWSRIVDCKNLPKTQWPGEQVFLIFSEPKWIASLELTLSNCEIQSNQIKHQNSNLSQALKELDEQIASLSQAVKERDGKIASLSQAAEERDGQIAGLNQATAERDGQIATLQKDLLAIKESVSWRVTWPIRLSKDLVTEPRYTAYEILRTIFWQLPENFRRKLKRRADTFVDYFRPAPIATTSSRQSNGTKDLSWDEFNTKILPKRKEHKGIFIQELTIDWHTPLYQRPQHIAVALSRIGYLTIYRTDNWAGDDVNGFREVTKNVWLTNRHEIDSIEGAVISVYSTAYATKLDNLKEISKKNILIYEYIDHIDPEISGDENNIKRLVDLKNFAFSGGVNFIIASAKKLQEEAIIAVGREKVISVPNGVDTDHYRNPVHCHTALPENYLAFKRSHKTIVGYFGALAPWLWYESIAELVEMRSDIGFVFIGPDYYGGSEKLPKNNNVLYLGTVDYTVLPAYAKLFDICFIPFKPGDIAKTTSPLKLFEYFALEKPVVVTSVMDECTAYPEVFRGGSVQELNEAINAAILVKDHEPFKLRLKELADKNDWIQRALAYEPAFSKISPVKSNNGCTELNHIQVMIKNCHRMDNDGKTYYEDAYMAQEACYWQPIPSWIDAMVKINSVIDVGAAYGTLLAYTALNKKCQHIYAIDPVGYMSKSLRRNIGIELFNLDFERENCNIPIKFDLVIFTEIIEHLNFHPLPTLQKIKNLMNPDGKLLLTTPDAAEWGRVTDFYPSIDAIPKYEGQDFKWIDGHIWQYSKNELDDLLARAGFSIEKFDYSPGVAARHLCYQLKISHD